MPSVTRTELKYSIWRRLAFEDEALVGFDVPFTTTAIETTTALEDSNLTRGGVQSSRYDGRQFEIMEAVTSPGTGPLVGETSWVQDLGFSSNILTGTTTLTNAIQTGTDYILWPRDISAALIDNEINNVLRHTDAPHLWVPTLAVDGNFETEGLTAGDALSIVTWPDISAAQTAVWTGSNIWGEWAISVLTCTLSEGVRSASFAVTEKEQMLVSITVQIGSGVGSVKLAFYDVTAAEDIDSVTIEEALTTEARFSATVPTDCEFAQVRFSAATEGTSFVIHAPVIVQSTGERSYAAPAWLMGPEMVREAFYLPSGLASVVSDSYIAGTSEWPRAPLPQFSNIARALGPTLHIEFSGSDMGLLGLICLRPFATMSANTDTTKCDREYLVSKVVANIKRKRGESKHRQFKNDGAGWAGDARNAAAIARARGYGKREMPIVANPVVVR